jgi:uncharacterized protein YjbI with pentapeptide repeats
MLVKKAEGNRMANQEHLDILKQGVEVWNQWRTEHPDMKPDLAEISGHNLYNSTLARADFMDRAMGSNLWEAAANGYNLSGANLSGAKLSKSNLYGSNLREANFHEADVSGSNLARTDLSNANLSNANLNGAYLEGANLTGANLRNSHLHGVDFHNANLNRVSFRSADFSVVNFNNTNLDGANFTEANLYYGSFGKVDLSTVRGLEAVRHIGPSTIGIDTIYRSQGNIPEVFLQGAGVDDSFITYIRSLIGKAIEYYSCFISYSSKDDAFTRRLYESLQGNNVRCWFAPEDIKIGDKFWHHIDESIRIYDKLLVVLSESSVNSVWVEREVMAALEKEKQGKTMLFPITLDDAVKDCTAPWAADIRRSRHIGDFRSWKNYDEYQKAFSRLLRDLKAAS